MIRNLLASVISVLLFIGSSALAQTSTWTIDTNQTQVGFQIRQVPISNVRGSFSGFTAELTGVVSGVGKAIIESCRVRQCPILLDVTGTNHWAYGNGSETR